MSVPDNCKLVIYKKFDEKRLFYTGEFTRDAITGYFNIYLFRSVLQFNDDSVPIIFIQKNPTLFFIGAGS